jgi:hypothetical protein
MAGLLGDRALARARRGGRRRQSGSQTVTAELIRIQAHGLGAALHHQRHSLAAQTALQLAVAVDPAEDRARVDGGAREVRLQRADRARLRLLATRDPDLSALTGAVRRVLVASVRRI